MSTSERPHVMMVEAYKHVRVFLPTGSLRFTVDREWHIEKGCYIFHAVVGESGGEAATPWRDSYAEVYKDIEETFKVKETRHIAYRGGSR